METWILREADLENCDEGDEQAVGDSGQQVKLQIPNAL